LLAGDGFLRRDKPIHKSLPFCGFDVRVFRRVHEHNAVLVEEALVALDQDCEVAPGREG